MDAVKTDEERGPFGAWAFRTRAMLDPLTVEQVARALSYSAPSLRKVESGAVTPSRRMLRDLPDYYRSVAADRGVAIDAPPPADETPVTDLSALVAATAAFTAAVDLQTQKLDRVWERLGDLIEALDRQPEPLTKADAMAMSEGLADGIGASLAGAIADLAAALRQPSRAVRDERG